MNNEITELTIEVEKNKYESRDTGRKILTKIKKTDDSITDLNWKFDSIGVDLSVIKDYMKQVVDDKSDDHNPVIQFLCPVCGKKSQITDKPEKIRCKDCGSTFYGLEYLQDTQNIVYVDPSSFASNFEAVTVYIKRDDYGFFLSYDGEINEIKKRNFFVIRPDEGVDVTENGSIDLGSLKRHVSELQKCNCVLDSGCETMTAYANVTDKFKIKNNTIKRR